jgi:hypothetical protein
MTWFFKKSMACVLIFALTGCGSAENDTPPEKGAPQRAGQAMNPAETAARLATIQAAAVTGNHQVVEQEFGNLHSDMMRSIRLPDATRRIAPEAARTAILKVADVRGAAWIDQHNLLVRVSGPQFKTYSMIDLLCSELAPLGDTLWVTMNLQDVTARSGDSVNTLTRNCQLPPGQHSLIEQPRAVDVIDPELRKKHSEDNMRVMHGESRSSRDYSRDDQAAIDAIPEI